MHGTTQGLSPIRVGREKHPSRVGSSSASVFRRLLLAACAERVDHERFLFHTHGRHRHGRPTSNGCGCSRQWPSWSGSGSSASRFGTWGRRSPSIGSGYHLPPTGLRQGLNRNERASNQSSAFSRPTACAVSTDGRWRSLLEKSQCPFYVRDWSEMRESTRGGHERLLTYNNATQSVPGTFFSAALSLSLVTRQFRRFLLHRPWPAMLSTHNNATQQVIVKSL